MAFDLFMDDFYVCEGRAMERVCFLLKVRKERLDEYKQRHRTVWADMRQALTARKQVLAACWTGILSFLVPFASGIIVGRFLYSALAPPQISMWEFSLFVGAALSVP